MPEFDELDLLLMMYAKKFNDSFPVFCVAMTDSEMKDAIKECIESGKPYKIEHSPDIIY